MKTLNRQIPTTPQGRALYTVSWFLKGKPALQKRNKPTMTRHMLLSC